MDKQEYSYLILHEFPLDELPLEFREVAKYFRQGEISLDVACRYLDEVHFGLLDKFSRGNDNINKFLDQRENVGK